MAAHKVGVHAQAIAEDAGILAKASRAWTASVSDGKDLHDVLAAAIKHIDEKCGLALVEIRIAG